MARPLPPGIFRTPFGYRVFQWVPVPGDPKGRIRSKRFKKDATIAEMKQWREDVRVDTRRQPATVIQLTGFAADAVTYLEAVRAMTTYQQRAKHIGEWVALFGHRPRRLIAPSEIRAQRDRWLTIGPRSQQVRDERGQIRWIPVNKPLSPSAVNDRLRALENLWTVLDGRHAANPVREVPECQEPDPQPRGQTFALAREILRHMPDVTKSVKGEAREAGSLSRVRFAAMLYTGMTPKQLGLLKPEHVNFDTATYLAPRRSKGRQGRRGRQTKANAPRPLLPQAIPVLKKLFTLGGNRPFSNSAFGRAVHAAVRAANKDRAANNMPLIDERLRVYDLTRHTFASEAYRVSGNLKAVQELIGHSDINMTARYAMAAVHEHTALAVVALSKLAGKRDR